MKFWSQPYSARHAAARSW